MRHLKFLKLKAVRDDPVFWVSRVAIFESSEKTEPFRNVVLQRGLNIVWAKDEIDDGDDGRATAAGHGAGKTTFCRLLRYCLGEGSFGKAKSIERIRTHFPD